MANKTVTLLQHNFDDGSQDLPVLSGTGSFSEVGGALRFNIPSGQSGDWWTGGRYSAAAYSKFGQVVGRYEKLIAECTFVSFSGNTYTEMFFNFYKGDLDWYQFFVDSGGVNLYARRMIGASPTTYASIPVPAYPFKVRMIWDVRNETIAFEYDSGGGWTTLQSAIDIGTFVPNRILFGGKNWTGNPAVQAEWDDALVTAEYNETQRLLDDQNLVQPVQAIDDLRVLDAGGPPEYHLEDQGVGQLAPGPVNQATGSVGPFDVAGPSDSAKPLPTGGPANYSPSTFSLGQRVPGPVNAPAPDHTGPNVVTGLSDRVLVKLYENLLRPGDDANYAKPANRSGFFDEIETRLGSVPEFNPYTPTTDPDAHVHLESGEVVSFFIYDTRNEPWSNPTSHPTFTGYGRDGTHYTNGVQDAGPVRAPWSTEGVAGNAHRSTRVDFPELALVAVSQNEVTIYDLDNFPTSLPMWMRFQAAQSSQYFFMGRGRWAIRDVRMKNGVLYCAANYTPDYSAVYGHLTVTDFKLDGDPNAHWLIRSNNAHNLTGGFDITDRNTTSWWASGVTSVRLESERPTRLDVYQDPDDPLRQWIALGGEDQIEVIEFYDGAPAYDYITTPTPEANLDESGTRVGMRGVIFDEVGQLYCYERLNDGETRVWRNGLDYQGGVLPHPFLDGNGDLTRRRYPKTVIPAGAVSITVGRQHVFVATNASLYDNLTGVWSIDRSSFEKQLAYSISGGGGVGVAGLQGEVLVGDKAPEFVRVWNQQKTTFLFVASLWGGGGVTVVRLLDDQVALSRVWPTLQEDGAYCAAGIVL